MRNPGGYAVLENMWGRKKECDTFSCAHCNRVVHVKPKCDPAELGGHCYICDKMICPSCVATGKCDPLEEKLARMEAVKSYG